MSQLIAVGCIREVVEIAKGLTEIRFNSDQPCGALVEYTGSLVHLLQGAEWIELEYAEGHKFPKVIGPVMK